jgi:hypothetical protein
VLAALTARKRLTRKGRATASRCVPQA